jgi:3-isopropylmalate/(R)-2-methylmalate dehydratase small subunit
MSFQPLNIITSPVVLLQAENIDTDRIIPARFLKSVESTGFGKNLFHDWRYRPDGSPDPDFVLNKPEGQGKILLTGKNFGCGSSREHAAWALYQYGFRVVISSGFADIFRTNALNNGLLPLEVTDQQLSGLMETYMANPLAAWTVDLNQQLLIPAPANQHSTSTGSFTVPFSLNSFRKECLLHGSDLIDYLAGLKPRIIQFEANHHIK